MRSKPSGCSNKGQENDVKFTPRMVAAIIVGAAVVLAAWLGVIGPATPVAISK